MEYTIPKEEILRQLITQLKSFFLVEENEELMLQQALDATLNRCEPALLGGVNILAQSRYSTLIIQ